MSSENFTTSGSRYSRFSSNRRRQNLQRETNLEKILSSNNASSNSRATITNISTNFSSQNSNSIQVSSLETGFVSSSRFSRRRSAGRNLPTAAQYARSDIRGLSNLVQGKDDQSRTFSSSNSFASRSRKVEQRNLGYQRQLERKRLEELERQNRADQYYAGPDETTYQTIKRDQYYAGPDETTGQVIRRDQYHAGPDETSSTTTVRSNTNQASGKTTQELYKEQLDYHNAAKEKISNAIEVKKFLGTAVYGQKNSVHNAHDAGAGAKADMASLFANLYGTKFRENDLDFLLKHEINIVFATDVDKSALKFGFKPGFYTEKRNDDNGKPAVDIVFAPGKHSVKNFSYAMEQALDYFRDEAKKTN